MAVVVQKYGGSSVADKTGAALAFVQLAIARAEVALDAAVGQGVPPAGRMERFCRAHGLASCHFFTA